MKTGISDNENRSERGGLSLLFFISNTQSRRSSVQRGPWALGRHDVSNLYFPHPPPRRVFQWSFSNIEAMAVSSPKNSTSIRPTTSEPILAGSLFLTAACQLLATKRFSAVSVAPRSVKYAFIAHRRTPKVKLSPQAPTHRRKDTYGIFGCQCGL
jgi:hypothetical protein